MKRLGLSFLCALCSFSAGLYGEMGDVPVMENSLAYVFTPGTAQTSYVENTNLIQSFYEAFEKNNVQELESTLKEGYKVNNVANIHQVAGAQFDAGSRNLHVRMSAYHRAFPNLSVKIEQMVATQDKVVAQVSMTGIQKGNFFGIAPTNRYITIHSMVIFTIVGDKITEVDEIISEYSLMRQLGYIAI